MDKESILNKIADLTAENLFDFIRQGVVTFDELKATLNLDALKRRKIADLISSYEREDNDSWLKVRYEIESDLNEYIAKYPKGLHVDEAKHKLDVLVQQIKNANAQKETFLDNIRRNPNFYPPEKIIEFLQNGIQETDLINCNIPTSAITNLHNISSPKLELGETPTEIPNGYTEVYFWGTTGSGKTCALGAILHKAEQKGYLNIASGPGYLYGFQLKNIFSDDKLANDYLPAPSPLETTQYIPFTLKRPNENYSRSVSLIELSGEIFKCFFHINAGRELPTQVHVNTFNSLKNFLCSNNRKIHFFFIDYNRENRPDSSGLKQSDYLAAASTYFNNNKIFDKTTDAVYVVLTKCDLLLDEQGNSIDVSQRVEYAKRYLEADNYKSFINTLKDNCRKNSINAGKLTVEPFTLGKVYFQQICDFEGSAAENIVEILMERIRPSRKSLLDVLKR